MAPGTLINSTLPGGNFGEYSGTSMAAAHVSGAIALYKSIYPNTSISEIEELIIGGAVYVDDQCNIKTNNGRGYINDWKYDYDDVRESILYIGSLQ